MGQARRYDLECKYLTTSGFTTVSGTNVYYVYNTFSGTSIFDSGTTFSYSAITITDLAKLSDQDYEIRLTDFISYVSSNEFEYTFDELKAIIESGQYDELFCVTPTTTTTTSTTTTTTIAPTTTTTTTIAPTTTTTTTIAPTTTTTTTIAPPPSVPCPLFHTGSFCTVSSHHIYPEITMDFGVSTGTIMSTAFSLGTPNRFTVRRYSNDSLVATTPWVGCAEYPGPWGFASAACPYSCCEGLYNFNFNITERYNILEVETVTGPVFTDSFEWTIPCP